MQRSESLDQLTAALAKASEEFPHIERGCTAKVATRTGGSYSYSYADLNDVLSAVRPALAKNGLTLTHDCKVVRESVEIEGEQVWQYCVETTAILEHASGQWKQSSPFLIPCDGHMAAAQLVGSGATYGKRYTAQNILGLSTESDDDGNGAAGNDATTSKRAPRPACPQCGKSEFVFENKQAPGWFCWHNEEKKKLGCGHKWDDAAKPGYTEVSPGIHAPNGSATAQAANLSADDAKFVEEASASFLECESAEAARKLWKAISDSKSPQVKTLIHPTYQRVLHSFAGSA